MSSLFHISEDGSITSFAPRTPPSGSADVTDPVVWAIDEKHIQNYLLPRECPRVTYHSLPTSTREDVTSFLGSSKHVIAIETAWKERASKKSIWIYELPSDSFSVLDAGAGYYVSKTAVVPTGKRKIDNPLDELARLEIDLRVIPSLWPLYDDITKSSLQFSCIRMRNSQGR